MRQVLVLAVTTVRELARERWVWVIAGLGIFMIALSLVLAQMSFDEGDRLLADFGLAAVEIAVTGLGLFAGATLLSREIERQTLLLILSKPLSRGQFLAGKSLGLLALFAVLIASQCLFLFLLLQSKPSAFALGVAGSTILWKALCLFSFALFLGSWVRPVIAFAFGLTLWMLGNWLGDLKFIAEKAENIELLRAVEAAAWIVPNFDRFNWKSFVDLQSQLGWSDLGASTVHFGLWGLLYFVLATWSFGRKDLV